MWQDLLADGRVRKVGVAVSEDASKVRRDLGVEVRGYFDVRHLIERHPDGAQLCAKAGLSALTHRLLDVQLDKELSVSLFSCPYIETQKES